LEIFKYAVTKLNGTQKYWYDANGNMTTRIVGTDTYTLGYDYENHLTSVSGGTTANYVYDGDGNRVKSTNPDGTTMYIGNHTEVFTPATAVPTPPANPAPAALSFGGKTISQGGSGLGNLSVSLRRQQTCPVPGTGYLSATALGSKFSQLSEATLDIYSYTGQFVSSVTEYCSGVRSHGNSP
jgi:YD repeat-containing protein